LFCFVLSVGPDSKVPVSAIVASGCKWSYKATLLASHALAVQKHPTMMQHQCQWK